MADLNRSAFLPAQISSEIIQKTLDQSAVMSLARQITLPGTGVAVPVITADPEAAWVGETGSKTVSNSTVASKLLQPYKLAVIETFSAELTRDASALYEALIQRLPGALAKKFDSTVIGAVSAPGSNFDSFASVTAIAAGGNEYGALCEADYTISGNGGIVNGYAISPQARSILLGATDDNGRPLFVNNAAEGAIPMILGAPTVMGRGVYKAETGKNVIAVAGDWTQAVFGTVEGIQISVSDQATLTSGGSSINLWQQNMVAVRAEIEVGFRCNTDMFVKITDESV